MEKEKIWELLGVKEKIGVQLTEHFAMYPASSVSGLFLSHPESKYFSVGRVHVDQLEDYSKRKGISTSIIKKWLGSYHL